MSAAATTSASDLAKRLGATLDAAETELSAAGEKTRAEEVHATRTRRRDTPPVVVVAGEAKSGKSSLINALIGRPGLSPVSADIATGSWVSFSYFPSELAAVQLMGEDQPRNIGVDEIEQWASVAHNPRNEKGVQSVAVALNSPLLEGMTLVDTPGVGGLDRGHGAFTLQALRRADALLFVLDPDNPLSVSELRFLGEAADRIDTVVIVLTKKDTYRAWKKMLSDNARLLARYAPRFAAAPMVAVSSLLAQEAVRIGEGPNAELLRAESGFPALEAILQSEVVERTGTLRLANALRHGDAALESVELATKERIAALRGDPEVERALAHEKERLLAFKRDRAEWRIDLDEQLRQINLDRTNDVAREIAELQIQYDGRANEVGQEDLDALPGALLDEVAALADRIAAQTSERIKQAAVDVVGDLDDGEDSPLSVALGKFGAPALDSAQLAPPVRRATTEIDRLRAMQTWSSGRSIGGYVATLPMFAIGGVPLLVISFAGASVFAWRTHKGYKLISLQGDFKAWSSRQLNVAERHLNNAFNSRMIRQQRELTKAIGKFIESREQQVNASIAAYEQARQGDAATREREGVLAEQRLARLRDVRSELGRALGELRAAAG